MERDRRSPAPIIHLVAHSRHPDLLLAELHARAMAATGATGSVLLELDASRSSLRPTSAQGLGAVGADPWVELPDSLSLVYDLFVSGHARQVSPLGLVLPDLAVHLLVPVAILAPVLVAGHGIGVLVLAMPTALPALEWADAVSTCADGFALALAGTRGERDARRQLAIDDLVQALSRADATDTPTLTTFCVGLAEAMACRRVTLWKYDRSARRLLPAAASDTAASPPADDERRTEAADTSTAVDIVGQRPAADGRPARVNAVVPLRGQRRALGRLVLDDLPLAPGDLAPLHTCLTRLGFAASAAIEGRQLLARVVTAHRELERVFDAIRDMVVVLDPQRRLIRANRQAITRLGLEGDTGVGEPIDAHVGAELGAWLRALSDSGPAEAQAGAFEVSDPVLDGEFRVTAAPLVAPDGPPGVVVVIRDVTDERRLERERAALHARLAQTEALANLVAGIAHELNNPLQSVIGHLELARHGASVPAPMDAALRRVDREATRAARIVKNLLLLSGTPGAGSGLTLRRVSLNRAVEGALRLRGPSLRRAGVGIDRQMPTLPAVRGDAILLRQVFLNIITNAEQAMTDGRERRLTVAGRLEGGRVVVTIRDTGPGLTPDVRERLFEAHFTTKGAGSGLGLPLARRIIEACGGTVDGANHPDGGAVFTVTLPSIR